MALHLIWTETIHLCFQDNSNSYYIFSLFLLFHDLLDFEHNICVKCDETKPCDCNNMNTSKLIAIKIYWQFYEKKDAVQKKAQTNPVCS